MRLYSSVICVGILITVCFPEKEQPVVVSDFCKQTAPEVAKLKRMSRAEFERQSDTAQQVLLAIRQKYNRNCK